jgi:hypothetical protein
MEKFFMGTLEENMVQLLLHSTRQQFQMNRIHNIHNNKNNKTQRDHIKRVLLDVDFISHVGVFSSLWTENF